jgi:hypothetical protein
VVGGCGMGCHQRFSLVSRFTRSVGPMIAGGLRANHGSRCGFPRIAAGLLRRYGAGAAGEDDEDTQALVGAETVVRTGGNERRLALSQKHRMALDV